MRTNLKEIYSFNPCYDGFLKICEYVHGSKLEPKREKISYVKTLLSEDEFGKEVSILEILNNNGVKDAFWSLRTQEYKSYCIILADVADSVLLFYEIKHPNNNSVKNCIEGIRKYHRKEITIYELKELAIIAAAADSAYAAAYAAAAAADAAAADAYADAYAAAAYAAAAAADAQWSKNERILRIYLVEKGRK